MQQNMQPGPQQIPVGQFAEEMQKAIGKDTQRKNFLAARMVAETVRSTLGPKGMDKMLIDTLGETIVTNDGATILTEMQIEHPAAKMIVNIAKTQDNEVGDGTTTAVILAGELVKKATVLLDEGIHPTVIVKGYHKAANQAMELMKSQSLSLKKGSERELLIQVAETAMTGKGAESAKKLLAEIVVKTIDELTSGDFGEFDKESIKVVTKEGESISSTELISGIIMDKEKVHPSMPDELNKVKILLLNEGLEVKETETDAKIQVTDPSKIKDFLDQEETMVREMVNTIKESGANVVMSQKGIDDLAQHFLIKERIYAVRHVAEKDMRAMAKATGGRIMNSIKELGPPDLGQADKVEEKKVGDSRMVFVTGCSNPKAMTILVRGGTLQVVNEVERALNDAIGVTGAVIKSGEFVPGAGAFEVELSKNLRKIAEEQTGREQLAFKAFADALEIVPKTLAENAGLDKIDVLTELRAAHSKEGGESKGIDVFSGKLMEAAAAGVVEPLQVKSQAIRSATEVVEMLLRIDDMIASKGENKEGQ